MPAVDYFLKIDGIDGESTDAKHKGQIDVLAFSWGEQATTDGGTGRGPRKVSIQDFHFTEHTNKASPKLLLACATGERIRSAVLACRRAGQQDDFLTITMTEVQVASFEVSGNQSGDPVPVDEVALNFAKITLEYRPEGPGGTLGTPVTAGWDVKTGSRA